MSLTDEGRFTSAASLAPPPTNRPPTLVEDSRLCAVTRTRAFRATPIPSDITQPSAVMTATLYAELGGTVPNELVDEIVRAVLDERRQGAQDGATENMMLEARQRLDRFVRARSAS